MARSARPAQTSAILTTTFFHAASSPGLDLAGPILGPAFGGKYSATEEPHVNRSHDTV